MSFLAYDIIFFVLFTLFVIIFISIKKGQMKREGLIYMYRSKFGLNAIEYIGEKYKKILHFLEPIVIGVCYASMAAMIYILLKILYTFLNFPEFVRAVKIPPVMPLIPYLPEIFKVDFLPPFYFTYWLVVLAVTAIFHEFFHGIFSKKNNVRIKTTGFYFLGPFTGAFVEPDEKEIKKLGFRKQAAIFGAGSFSNWILTILFFLIMWGFFSLTFVPSGVMFNSYAFSVLNTSDIQKVAGESNIQIDGMLNMTEVNVNNNTYFIKDYKPNQTGMVIGYDNSPALKAGLSGVIVQIGEDKISKYEDLRSSILNRNPGESVIIKTLYNKTEKVYNITLGEKNGNAYIGILLIGTNSKGIFGKIRTLLTFFKEPNTNYLPINNNDLIMFVYHLLWWMTFINLSVALGNMLPLGIFDGGRFFYVTVRKLFKSDKIAKKALLVVTYIMLFIFLLLMVSWAFSMF